MKTKAQKDKNKYNHYTEKSRRIDNSSHLVYTVDNHQITIISCRYHY